ncbi:MAG: beta-hydroxyacyl-ACP dehydratase [Christensenellaceae bacterium]|nr:beta-hydroxyacyl-ACP dehydratase [Christensenellaceae bacterium]
MNREELMNILPHRDNMLLLDEAEVIDGRAHGRKYITGDEFFLKGHFPGNPIVPGVILCEIMAQSTCVLIGGGLSGSVRTLFTGLNDVRFKRSVRPGELFTTVCEIEKSKGPFYWAKGKGFVGGELCVSASFSFAVFPEKETGNA